MGLRVGVYLFMGLSLIHEVFSSCDFVGFRIYGDKHSLSWLEIDLHCDGLSRTEL